MNPLNPSTLKIGDCLFWESTAEPYRMGRIIILRENSLAKPCNRLLGTQIHEGLYAVVEFENGSQSVVEDFSKVKLGVQ